MDEMKRKLIAKRLEEITSKNNGRLTPDDVVEEARNKKSPLHDQFDWDDSLAASKWRLEQARSLIRSVTVVIETESRKVSTVCYVRDPSVRDGQGYVPVAKLRNEKDLARDALRHELAQVRARMERAESLAAAFEMEGEAKDVIGKVQAMSERLEKAA